MSFYSALVLAANEGVRRPSPRAVRALFGECGLLDREGAADSPEDGTDYTLADHVADLFRDREARAENDRFFLPGDIGLFEGVEVQTPAGDYNGPGWSVAIHGYGYFFPWELADLRERVIRSPALVRLKVAIEERFGGRFVFPADGEELLRPRLIDGTDGWVWFASEDV